MPAYELVRAVIPAESLAERASDCTNSPTWPCTGLTAGNAMDFDGDSERLLGGLAAEVDLPLRLRFAPFCMPGADPARA